MVSAVPVADSTKARRRPRSWTALVTAAVVAAGSALIPVVTGGTAAHAAEGAAPAPSEYRVLAKVHTDAVSTFLDDGAFTLGTKADLEEGIGTRLDPDTVWFHVDDDSLKTVPSGYEFIAPAGTKAWIAPESNPFGGGSVAPQLWPGFSTESIPVGGVDNNQTTFTLTQFDGPGNLEVFTGDGAFGSVTRLWSTDEGISSFTVGRTHMHANWAFTHPGIYHLTVEGTATIGGTAVSDSATYSFVVGPLAPQVETSTALSVSANEITSGDLVTLDATVTGDAEGYVEFYDGEAILGHVEIEDGSASFQVSNLGLGERDLSARFVPVVANLASASTSDVVTVRVLNQNGELFGIAGLQPQYDAGSELALTMSGIAQDDALQPRFEIMLAGETTPSVVEGWTLTRVVDPSWENARIRAVVLDGTTVLARSAQATLDVRLTAEPITAQWLNTNGEGNVYIGDDLAIQLSRPLVEGESVRLMQRTTTSGSFSTWGQRNLLASWVDGDVFHIEVADANDTRSYNQVQVLREGEVVAQSPQFRGEIKWNHAVVSGIQPVYRTGAAFDLQVDEFYPGIENTEYYSWTIKSRAGNASSPSYRGQQVVLAEGSDFEAIRHLQWSGNEQYPDGIPAEWNNWHLDFNAYRTYEESGERIQVNDFYRALVRNIQVRELDPNEQLLFLRQPPEHYHSDINTVALDLVGDPPLAAEDQVRWEWKWPGSDEWLEMTIADPAPELGPTKRPYVAEQAWNGVQVRAIVTFFGSDAEPMAAAPIAIKVDDHGRGASQRPMVIGESEYAVGDEVTLTSDVQGFPTALEDRRWERRDAGSSDWSVIEGESDTTLSFTATAEDNGAEFRAAVVNPLGQTMYPAAGTFTLTVSAAAATAPEAPEQPGLTVEGQTLTVSWAAPADGGSPLTGYTVTVSPVDGEPISQDLGPDATSATFTEVPGGTWAATIVARNSAGSSPASPASEAVTVVASDPDPDATVPATPGKPGITVEGSVISVTWEAPDDGGSAIASYTVTLTPADGEPVTRVLSSDTLTATFEDVPAAAWRATVVATNAVGSSDSSPASDEVTVTSEDPDPTPTVPAAPSAPTAAVSGSSVTVTWVAPADGGSPLTGYTVMLTPQSGEPLTKDAGAGDTSATFTDVAAGQWTATVIAKNAQGSSATSPSSASVTVVEAAPDPDPTPTPTPGEDTTPTPEPSAATPVPDSDLTDATRGGVTAPSSATPGETITVTVPGHAGEQVRLWLHSTPLLLGTTTLNSASQATVTIPANVPPGDHRIVVQALDGTVLGWDNISIARLASTGSDFSVPGAVTAASLLMVLGLGALIIAARRRREMHTR